MSDMNTYSTKHPHEPEIPPAIDGEGRCLVCKLLVESAAQAARIRELEGQLAITIKNEQNCWARREEAGQRVAEAEQRAESAEQRLEKVEKDAARYRSIRLKAWLDSCTDDLVVGTPQAKESEFNEGYDQMIDAEYPDASKALS